MIRISGVRPTAKDLRPYQNEGARRRLWTILSDVLPISGLGAAALVASVGDVGDLERRAIVGITALTCLIWLVVRGLWRKELNPEASGIAEADLGLVWQLNLTDLRFGTSRVTTVLDWTDISDISEQTDRFVFLSRSLGSLVLPKGSLEASQVAAVQGFLSSMRRDSRLGPGVD